MMEKIDKIIWQWVLVKENERKKNSMKKTSEFINPEKGKTYNAIDIFYGSGYRGFNHHDIEELHKFLFDKSITHYVQEIVEDEELCSLVVYLKETTKDTNFKTNIDADLIERLVKCLN